ncbi:Uncharacterised protein [Chlamydia abortus]|nr:Uncharacterised protein [Chlamydia abortus]
MARKTDMENLEMSTVGRGIWQENCLENLEMSTVGRGIWQAKIMENEKHPLDDLKNDERNHGK